MTPKQQTVVDAIKASTVREAKQAKTSKPFDRDAALVNAERADLAARDVETEGITIKQAADRHGVSYHAVWSRHRRLYSVARRWR